MIRNDRYLYLCNCPKNNLRFYFLQCYSLFSLGFSVSFIYLTLYSVLFFNNCFQDTLFLVFFCPDFLYGVYMLSVCSFYSGRPTPKC